MASKLYEITGFSQLDPDDAAEKVGILLEQRGFCVIPANLDSSVAEMDIHLLKDLGCLQRTPEEVLDAYFGSASTWTYELEPSDDAPEDFAGLYALDSELQEIGCIVSEAQMFSQRAVSRSAGLLHCDEMFFDEEPEDGPRLSDPSEAAPYLAHCTQRKVVLLFAFQDTDVTLQPRSDLSDAIDVDIPAGSILVCLHEAVVLSVARSSLLLQLDLLLECGGQHKTKEELLPVPSSLMRQYAKMIESVKDSAPSDAPMLSLKDAHLDRSEGISIVSLFTELPTLPQDNGLGAAVQASLLGGLDTVREVVQPPKTARLGESQYFGAKWDLAEYFDEDPRGDDFKVYSKHLSVLYRSYDVAGDFDYRYFGFDKAESYDLDQRCRLLCEGTERALHEAGHLPKSRVARSWGLFSGLSGVRELLPVRSMLKSSPAAILGQVSEAFDFTGPVMALDTGDSSGLVASQTAVEQLRRSCDVALVSSASWISSPLELALHCATGSVSRTGRTRTFDQSADGFTQGEGVVVAMLQASGARDGRGHVVGTAMNSQGRGASLSAPSSAAMQEVLVKAERDARVPFVVVDAVETSSVGSSRTDAVELAVLGAALRHKDPQPVMVGCSKASFSHTGPSSGLASLAKAIFLMEKNCFGPQLHLSRLLTLAADPKRLQFCTEATQGLGHKQLASVAAFSASGSNCQQLISVNPRQKGIPQKAHQLSWWPTQVKKKDVLVPITGYYLACSLSAWQEAIPLNRDEDEPGSFSCVLQLRDDGKENFQIWLDEDPDKVLHPPRDNDISESLVLGPAANVDRSRSWRVAGTAGEHYKIRLQVNGRYRRVGWEKVDGVVGKSSRVSYSIIGDHSFWLFQAMRSNSGVFDCEVKLLKETSNFQIYRDADFQHGFYPAAGAKPTLHLGDAEPQMLFNREDILGPDEQGHGHNFQISGKVGDVFRVVFQPSHSECLSWQRIDWQPVDFQALAKSHCYSVVGSWDNFQQCQEMARDEAGNWSTEVQIGKSGKELFQVLLNGNWLSSVHPVAPFASLDDELEGPDDAGHDRYWCIGSGNDHFEHGDTAEIHLTMKDGMPQKVWWQKSQSVRAHERSVAAGLRRTLERHLQVNGLVPFDPATQKSAHFVKAPEWYNDGRRKEASIPTQHLINECQERIWQRQKMMKEEGPDAVLRQLRERA
ncbi:unnamed protein product [Effrenium voratum]|nr:unnamed protein product [Effrenium voratum]